jgi:major membrane immunogen (membrane-anchored lipoprotein)
MRTQTLCKYIRNRVNPLIGVIGVLTIFTLTACEEKAAQEAEAAKAAAPPAVASGKCVKLPESMEYNDNENFTEGMKVFKYDTRNRLVEVVHSDGGGSGVFHILTYKGNDLATVKNVSMSVEGSSDTTVLNIGKGNTVSIKDNIYNRTETITTNNDGYIIRLEYKYDDGSVGKSIYTYQYQDGNLASETLSEGGKEKVTKYKYDNKKSPFNNSSTPKWILQYFSNTIHASKNNPVSKNSTVYKYKYDSEGFPTEQASNGYTATFIYSCK